MKGYYIEYDKWNNIERVSSYEFSALMNSCSVAAYTYSESNHSQLQKITYGNKGTVDYTYDDFGRVTAISYDGGVTNTFEYTYDTLGNVISVIDNSTGRKIYCCDGVTSVFTEKYSLIYYAGTDAEGNEFELSGAALYNTKKDADGTKITAGSLEAKLKSDSDRFGRVKEKSIEIRAVDNSAENPYTKVKTNYSYGAYNDSDGTVGKGKVQSILSSVILGENTLKNYEFSYEYDANGNITHEYSGSGDNRQLRYRYTYDEADQLVRVDDAVQNKTYVYAYDKGGNRETEKIYAFTTGDTLGEVLETKTSQYNYLVWKDRLSSFNGKAVKYDSAGNPTSYDDKIYKWDGRKLKEIALADGSKTQFEYDQDGLRTQKRQYKADGGLDYFVDYIWEDGKLVYQYLTLAVYSTDKNGVTTMREFGPFTVKIIYDDSGLPQGFMVNDSAQYAFVRNLQGDVIAMVDQNGETVMEYSYDPWGKIEYHLSDESLTEQDAALITALCPLTYRGYNYDFTTGLYYLQSRYYNPEWGRFLNCDDTNILLATQGETHNANLFAYCANNPVNRVDYTGYDYSDINIHDLAQFLILLFAANYYDSITIAADKHLKGGITIDLTNGLASYFIYVEKIVDENHKQYMLNSKINFFRKKENKTSVEWIDNDIAYYFIAALAVNKFYEEFPKVYYETNKETTKKREFLFDEECVAQEIKLHYIAWLGIKDTFFPKTEKRAEKADIYEYDVTDWKNKYAFSYKDGIREKYKYTLADPFYNPDKNKRTNKVRESWKTEKIPDNI